MFLLLDSVAIAERKDIKQFQLCNALKQVLPITQVHSNAKKKKNVAVIRVWSKIDPCWTDVPTRYTVINNYHMLVLFQCTRYHFSTRDNFPKKCISLLHMKLVIIQTALEKKSIKERRRFKMNGSFFSINCETIIYSSQSPGYYGFWYRCQELNCFRFTLDIKILYTMRHCESIKVCIKTCPCIWLKHVKSPEYSPDLIRTRSITRSL